MKLTSISKVLVLFVVTALFVSCGTSKKTTKAKGTDFSGNYEWVVEGVPSGDQGGTMSLKKSETGYTGSLDVEGMGVPIDGIKVEGNKMTGYIAVDEMDLSFTIVFEGDGFKGDIYAMGEGFPFNGTKLK